MSIAFYISGHGFGHASRDIEVLNALLDRRPDLPIVVRTPAERWLFDLTLRHPVRFEPTETDTGMVQIDSLRLDVEASLRLAASFYRHLDERAEEEANRLRDGAVRLVVADIPPLAFRAAALAGVPAVALGNFTWDWIYAGYPETRREAPDLLSMLADVYETAALALRLPMHGGFASIRTVRDIPFVARRSKRPPEEVRTALGAAPDRPIALLSFGGHGLTGLDLTRVDAAGRFTLVTTGEMSPAERGTGDAAPRPGGAAANPVTHDGPIIRVDERGLYAAGLRYEDLVAAADVVVTKPGYGIISECIANGTAMLYTSRGRFVENDVLVDCLPRVLRSRFIARDELYAGRWEAHLDDVLALPAAPERPATNGADVAADILLELLDSK